MMPANLLVASECRFADREELVVALAAHIWDLIEAAVERSGAASIILSGGSTPVPLYNVLRELPLPWGEIAVCLSDERWVAVEDPASNEGMLRRELFPHGDQGRFVSIARQAATPQEGASAVSRVLADRQGPRDLVLLGMGTDGHTASLFPGAPELAEALQTGQPCVALQRPGSDESRLTLSRKELLDTRRIVLLLAGEDKWRVYRQALAGDDSNELPVRAILHQQQAPVDVYWSVD